VRCSRCRHAWHQAPEEEALDLPEPLPENPPSLEAMPRRAEVHEKRAPERPKLNTAAEDKRGSGGLIIGWFLVLALLIGIGAAGYVFRQEIVAAVPEMRRLYDWLNIPVEAAEDGQLEVTAFSFSKIVSEGEPQISLSGEIVNRGRTALPVPPLAATLVNERGQALLQWQFTAERSVLAPSARTGFQSRHPNPFPERGADVRVDFVPQ